jgi:hypothetical protein
MGCGQDQPEDDYSIRQGTVRSICLLFAYTFSSSDLTLLCSILSDPSLTVDYPIRRCPTIINVPKHIIPRSLRHHFAVQFCDKIIYPYKSWSSPRL